MLSSESKPVATIKILDEISVVVVGLDRRHYEVFYDKFCSIDDGNASQRAVEAVFK